MKLLDITPITDAAEMPVKRGTLQFLQDSHKENLAALIIGLITQSTGNYNPFTVYVLYGCANSADLPTYTISAGTLFYNGEVFYFDAISFTPTGSNVGVFVPVITQYTTDADPVTFTDSTQHNVHNIRKLTLNQAATGSGYADYTQAYFLNLKVVKALNLQAPVTPPYADNIAQISGAFPDIQIYVPTPPGNLRPVLASGQVHIGNVAGAGTTIAINFGVPLPAGTLYYVVGTLVSSGDPHDDTSCSWTLINSSRNLSGFQIRLQEFTAVNQSLEFEWLIFKTN